MKHAILGLALALGWAPNAMQDAKPQDAKTQAKPAAEAPEEPKIKVGDIAPDFTLLDQNLKVVKLSDFRGKKNVALGFFVFAFTGGWTKQMQAFQANAQRLEAADTQVLGVSIDTPFSNKKWAEDIKVNFPLLSDFGGETLKKYGIAKEYPVNGVKVLAARRVNYLIDKSGKVIEMQLDQTAIDPLHIVEACERKKLKE